MRRNPNEIYRDSFEESDGLPDVRAAWAIGFSRAAEISGIAFEAILPALAGVWLDFKLGTVLVFFAVGLVFGLMAATIHLLRFVKKLGKG